MTTIEEFIRSLPKAELHLHLEGTVQPQTLIELCDPDFDSEIERETDRETDREQRLSLSSAQRVYQYADKDFAGFLQSFSTVARRLSGAPQYELVARRMIESLAAQGVVHAEVYFAVGELFRAAAAKREIEIERGSEKERETESQSLLFKRDCELFEKVFSALERAREDGEREFGVSVYWILDSTRHEGVSEARRVFDMAMTYKHKYPSIVGVGLGGDERVNASEPFRELFAEAKKANLRLTNHAGENTPAQFIWEALSIGSERLGHACSAIHDSALIEELRSRQIPLELNPSSNVKLGNCLDIKSHPLRKLFDAGLLVTLNSDDPAFFHSTLENEYKLAHLEQDFTREELKSLAVNSFKASFLPNPVKLQWIAKIEELVL